MNINKAIHSNLFENFISLGIIQGINYLLPIITIPFLYNQLGVETYGMVNFSIAFVQYFILITDFGFGLSGTRYIASERSDKPKVNRYLNSASLSRLVLCVLSFVVYISITYIIPTFRENRLFVLLLFGQVVGNVMNPSWFFQGVEKMKFNTLLHVTTRIISILPLFIIVKRPEDCIYIPICYSLGSIVAGILSMILIKKQFKMRFYFTSVNEVKQVTIDSSRYFLSRLSNHLYNGTNTFMLGLVCGNIAVGYYSLADKIYTALCSIYSPLNGALFPYMTQKKNVTLFKKFLFLVLTLNILMIVVFYILFPKLSSIFFDSFSNESYKVLTILLIGALIELPAIFLGYPFLAALGHPNACNYSQIGAALVHLSGLLILYAFNIIDIYNVAILVVITEFIILLTRVFATLKYKLWTL